MASLAAPSGASVSALLAGLVVLGGLGACHLERRPPVTPAETGVASRGGVDRGAGSALGGGGGDPRGAPGRMWATMPGSSRIIGRATRVLDLAGSMVLPGFQDTHAHPLSGGLELGECNLYDAETAAEIEGRIRACASAASRPALDPGQRLAAAGLSRGPIRDKALLDRAVPDRPAFFYAADGHSAWVNSRALALAGITRETQDPPNGRIERDPRTGEPSGTLREAAIELVAQPAPTLHAGGADRRRAPGAGGGQPVRHHQHHRRRRRPRVSRGVPRASRRRGELTRPGDRWRCTTTTSCPSRRRSIALRGLRARYRGGQPARGQHREALCRWGDRGPHRGAAGSLSRPSRRRRVAGLRAGQTAGSGSLASTVRAFRSMCMPSGIAPSGSLSMRWRMPGRSTRRVTRARSWRTSSCSIPRTCRRFRALGVVASFQPYWAQADEYITRSHRARR